MIAHETVPTSESGVSRFDINVSGRLVPLEPMGFLEHVARLASSRTHGTTSSCKFSYATPDPKRAVDPPSGVVKGRAGEGGYDGSGDGSSSCNYSYDGATAGWGATVSPTPNSTACRLSLGKMKIEE